MGVGNFRDPLSGAFTVMTLLTFGSLMLATFLDLFIPVSVNVDLGADVVVVIMAIATLLLSLVRIGVAHGEVIARHGVIKWLPVSWLFLVGITVLILVLDLSSYGII